MSSDLKEKKIRERRVGLSSLMIFRELKTLESKQFLYSFLLSFLSYTPLLRKKSTAPLIPASVRSRNMAVLLISIYLIGQSTPSIPFFSLILGSSCKSSLSLIGGRKLVLLT